MKKLLPLIVFAFMLTNTYFSQNVGVGTTSPTNTLHVVVDPTNPNQDPVKFEGLIIYTTETSVLAVDPVTGVVKHMPLNDVLANVDSSYLDSTILTTVLNNMDTIFSLMRDSLLLDSTFMNTLRDSINTDDQNIDSLTINGTTLTTYIEDGASANVDLSGLLDSVIFSKSDSLYTFISDSLNKDTLWIKQLDSLLNVYGDTIYFNDSSYTLVRDSLLKDSLFLDSLVSLIGDSINTDDQNIDSLTINGTTLTTYIEDGASANIDLSGLLDSVIFSKSDSLYTFIADSLNKDTLWIKQLDSLLGVYGDTIYFNDSSYTLIRDSLLKDSLFLDSLVSLIGDSINTDDQNIDSLTINGTTLITYIENGTSANVNLSTMLDSVIFSKSDSLYTFISDSLNRDTLWIKQLDSLLSIYGDTVYFNDTTYALISDSLLNDTLWIDSLGKLLNDNDWNINANGTGLEAAAAGDNLANGAYAIAAGQMDTASAPYSSISGGQLNKVTGMYSSITGGFQNRALGSYSTLGGYRNYTNSNYTTIFGYNDSVINATLDGNGILGKDHTISGLGSTGTGRNYILGGANNKIRNLTGNSSHSLTIVGGYNHEINGGNKGTSSIFGGQNNKIIGTSGWDGTIVGGRNDTIGTGGDDIIIAGAHSSKITGSSRSGILSGRKNKITSSSRATIVGGFVNEINAGATGSSIIGGDTNTVSNSADLSIILGGRRNTVNNFAQVALGHYSSSAVPAGSSSSTIDPDNILFKIGNGTGPSNLNDAVQVYANGVTFVDSTIGINTITPTNQLHVAGGTDPLRLEGLQYGGAADSVLVTDDNGVVKLTTASALVDSVILNDSLFTPNSVIFAGAGGELSEDNPRLNTFFNAYGERVLSINHDSIFGSDTYTVLQAVTDDPAWGSSFNVSDQNIRIATMNNSGGGGEPRLELLRARGNLSGEAAVVVNTNIGNVFFSGYDGTGYRKATQINGVVKGFGATGYPRANLNFGVRSYAGVGNAPTIRMTLDTIGRLGIGTQTPTTQLHVAGTYEPLRLEGLQYGGTTDSVLVTDGTGVVKLSSVSSLNTKNFVSTAIGYVVANGVDVVLADLTASAFTVTLPDPTTNAGRVVKVKRTDDATSTNGLSIATPSGTVDGVASPYGPFVIGFQGFEFMSDGTNWWVLTRF